MDSNKLLLQSLYDDRKNFTIVALTGYVGTGCTRLAKLMKSPFNQWGDLRNPEDLNANEANETDNEVLLRQGQTNHESIAQSIFKRKYTICHDYLKEHYVPFRVIKYSNVLLFYCCKYWAKHQEQAQTLKSYITQLLEDKYRPSRGSIDDDYRRIRCTDDANRSFDFASEAIGCYPWKQAVSLENFVYDGWEELEKKFRDPELDSKAAVLFFDEEDKDGAFSCFCRKLVEYLWNEDPYCTDFFFHRLSYVIRACGDPLKKSKEVFEEKGNDGSNIYNIVGLINSLIKGYKEQHKGEARRFVIDKIRNSLEAKYLKERYSAFYLVAVHDDNNVSAHLKNRLEHRYATQQEIEANSALTECQVKHILRFDMKEREGKDFEKGKFFSPNTSQCVADAEIHLSNVMGIDVRIPYFHSIAEQWMKYAALIQHPGLITPSSEERCMVVAYTAKFNSGCLSRQVGAVITNEAHSIRTIGWNDVPYGQIPCSLRLLQEMAKDDGEDKSPFYSRYERTHEKLFKDGQSFGEKVRLKYVNLHRHPENELMRGFPFSYCFKSLQNEFEKEKNQVHTRSLHAEENAILQMAKYGGEKLHNGVIYVTASPCELCCKKLYQIGVRKIVYIDEYPGISRENIISIGFHRPHLKQFQGAYGATYFKLYQPLISYKDELSIRMYRTSGDDIIDYNAKLRNEISQRINIDIPQDITSEKEYNRILNQLDAWLADNKKDEDAKD